ncbi:formate/nitrite transporter family protein [uncultured Mailhella sp.]|uniref:formate/nitrite transporter family protein n=1 Tax=uncultured Mailhella sp. TaxID=1981031 RepID=UPI00262E7692|nr:formate/nitrite transporter family protein [uncultured Mailhella sp.]
MADRTLPSTLDAVAESMRAKAALPLRQALTLAVLGGAYIALAGFGSTAVSCNLTASPDTWGLGRCLSGLLFPIGLMMIVVGGGELFTGNCLMPEAVRRNTLSVPAMLRSWLLVYLGNAVGAVITAWLLSLSGLFQAAGGAVAAAVIRTAAGKAALGGTQAFVLGILCNWLVCLAVWLSSRTDTAAHKALLLFFPIWLFVASGYEHSVANMYYLSAGVLAAADPAAFAASGLAPSAVAALSAGGIAANMLFVTLGNIVGGALFVGGAYALAYGRRT